jgi:hypothetical protein
LYNIKEIYLYISDIIADIKQFKVNKNIFYLSTMRYRNYIEYDFYKIYNYYISNKFIAEQTIYYITNNRLDLLLSYHTNNILNKEIIIYKNIIRK